MWNKDLAFYLSRWFPTCYHLWSHLPFPHWLEGHTILRWSQVSRWVFLDFLWRFPIFSAPSHPQTPRRQFLLSRQDSQILWWRLLGLHSSLKQELTRNKGLDWVLPPAIRCGYFVSQGSMDSNCYNGDTEWKWVDLSSRETDDNNDNIDDCKLPS